jgi:hypothetical protein
MALTATTELEAINTLLSTIGETPINSLAGAAGVADAVIAQQVLKEVSVEVQQEAWHFNTEKALKLTPDLANGYITLPLNCIECDTTGQDQSLDVSVRGQRLYNKTTHSFQFDRGILVDMVVLLEFNELPQAARHYITVRAGRVFQERTVGSQTLSGFSEKDEVRARAAIVRLNTNTGDYNILSGSPASTLFRGT